VHNQTKDDECQSDNFSATDMLEEKPSTISTAKLNALRHVHLPPIQPVVYRRSYPLTR
jgi:hypothetical protein